jgi:hypothetical protein
MDDPRELSFLVSGGTAMNCRLSRCCFAASRFKWFSAGFGAPSHRLPQGSGQGIVAGQISTPEVARHALKYGMFATAPAASGRDPPRLVAGEQCGG